MFGLVLLLFFVVGVPLIALAWLWTRLPKSARKFLREISFPRLAAVLRFVSRAVAQFGVLLASTRGGRALAFVLAALVLLDAAWGSDGVGVPFAGLLFLAALVVGGVAIRRWDRWCARVEMVLRENLPRYRQTAEDRAPTRYGAGRGLRLYVGEFAFRFEIPAAIQPGDLVNLEEKMRSRLPAEKGTSFGFDWRLRDGFCNATAVADIPDSITLAAALNNAQASAAGYAPNWVVPLSADALTIPLGVALSREGRIEIRWEAGNLFGSLLVAGAPGGGKSCLIRQIVAHCMQYPDDWRVRAIDMKRVELGYMRKYAPVVEEVAVELEPAAKVFSDARAEMRRRYKAIEAAGLSNIHELSDLLESRGRPRLPHLLVVSDEVAELVMTEKGKSEEAKANNALKDQIRSDMLSLAQLGRASGVHQVLSTQRPTKEYIDTAIKSLVLARVAMGGLDRIGSDVAIESPMAADLPGISGRGVWYRSGQLTKFQAYYAATTDLDSIHAARRAGSGGKAAA